MTQIHIDSNEVVKIKEKMIHIAETLAQVSSGNYITGTLFYDSQGQSADYIDEFLQVLVQCSQQMESVYFSTCRYLTMVINQFGDVENEYRAIFERTREDVPSLINEKAD